MHGPYPTLAMQSDRLKEERPFLPQLAAEHTPTEEALHQMNLQSLAVRDAQDGLPTIGERTQGVSEVPKVTREAAQALGKSILGARNEAILQEPFADYSLRQERAQFTTQARRHERSRRLGFGK